MRQSFDGVAGCPWYCHTESWPFHFLTDWMGDASFHVLLPTQKPLHVHHHLCNIFFHASVGRMFVIAFLHVLHLSLVPVVFPSEVLANSPGQLGSMHRMVLVFCRTTDIFFSAVSNPVFISHLLYVTKPPLAHLWYSLKWSEDWIFLGMAHLEDGGGGGGGTYIFSFLGMNLKQEREGE